MVRFVISAAISAIAMNPAFADVPTKQKIAQNLAWGFCINYKTKTCYLKIQNQLCRNGWDASMVLYTAKSEACSAMQRNDGCANGASC